MARAQPTPGRDEAHHASARQERSRRRQSVVMQPPLTPMIDVVFQLLLFFLLGCQFRQAEGQIPANLPDISGPQNAIPAPIDPIKVTLAPAGARGEGVLIVVGEGKMQLSSIAEWHAYLLREARRHPGSDGREVPVIIKAVGRVQWRHVVNAFHQAVRARYRNIAFSPSEG